MHIFSGVTVHRKSGDINILAKKVVSDAGVANTFKYLLPPEIAQKSRKFEAVSDHVLMPDPT